MRDEVLERIFAEEEMQKIPLEAQSRAIKAVDIVLKKIKEENPYATINELFESTGTGSSADVPELQFSNTATESIY